MYQNKLTLSLAFIRNFKMAYWYYELKPKSEADLGRGGKGGAHPSSEMTCGFLIQQVFCNKKAMWFIGVELKHKTRLKNFSVKHRENGS